MELYQQFTSYLNIFDRYWRNIISTPSLTHFIIVRQDLPLGTMAAMVAHAAGESSPLYEDLLDFDAIFTGSTVVILGVHNENKLIKVEELLSENHIQYVAIEEPDTPYNGQLMAIGLVPIERSKVADILRPLQTLKTLILPKGDDDPEC